MRCKLLVGIALLLSSSGCFFLGDDAILVCEDQEYYSGSQEIAPIEVPDDLDAPDDSQAFSIPEVADGRSGPADVPCTESPPDFFSEELPG